MSGLMRAAEAVGEMGLQDFGKRMFPRVACSLPVGQELVAWDDFDVRGMKKPDWLLSRDLCAAGLGLETPLELPDGLRQQLAEGLLKVRLAIRLPGEHEPVITFARLAWADAGKAVRCGLNFIDIPEPGFRRINQFVQSSLGR